MAVTSKDWEDAYSEYSNALRGGEMDIKKLKSIYDFAPQFTSKIDNLYKELEAQQKSGTGQYWNSGELKSKQDAALDMAFRLAEAGASSLKDIGQREVDVQYPSEFGDLQTAKSTEIYNKATGEAMPDWNRLSSAHNFDMDYHLQFDKNGNAVPYSTNQQSDWVSFRDDVLRPAATTIGSFIPGVGPYIAAANAAYAASKGDWQKALMSGLSAAVPLAGDLGASANTVSTLNNVRQAATVLKALEDKDLLGAALGGANLSGVSDIAGYSMDEVNKAVNMVKALGSEDPAAIIKAGAGFMPKGGFGGPNSSDFTQGYFEPGGEGYIAPPTYAPGTKGYFDEITGHFVPDEGGGLTFGQLTNQTSGTNLGSMDDYKYNPDTGSWTLPDGTEIDTSYMQNPRTPLTGADLLNRSGAGVATQPGTKPPAVGAKPPATAAKPAGGSVDLNQLMSLLGGQQAAPTVVSSGQDNSADVQLMEDIFGTTLSAPPAGDTVAQSRELARLLRS